MAAPTNAPPPREDRRQPAPTAPLDGNDILPPKSTPAPPGAPIPARACSSCSAPTTWATTMAGLENLHGQHRQLLLCRQQLAPPSAGTAQTSTAPTARPNSGMPAPAPASCTPAAAPSSAPNTVSTSPATTPAPPPPSPPTTSAPSPGGQTPTPTTRPPIGPTPGSGAATHTITQGCKLTLILAARWKPPYGSLTANSGWSISPACSVFPAHPSTPPASASPATSPCRGPSPPKTTSCPAPISPTISVLPTNAGPASTPTIWSSVARSPARRSAAANGNMPAAWSSTPTAPAPPP